MIAEKIPWKDKNVSCRCESCGKIVPEKELRWEKHLGYCASCYKEIQEYNKKKSKSDFLD